MDKTKILKAIELLQQAAKADNAYDAERLVVYAQVEIDAWQDRPEAPQELGHAIRARQARGGVW
jgi:hypothetical protein